MSLDETSVATLRLTVTTTSTNMKQLPTYRQQYDKIIDAYFKDEIKPMDSSFCFCGTLAPDRNWAYQNDSKRYHYTVDEYRRMESPLINDWNKKHRDAWYQKMVSKVDYDGYEDDLFIGMAASLDELKKIHEEHGEVIDEVPVK